MQTVVSQTKHRTNHVRAVARPARRTRADDVAIRFGQNLLRCRRREGLSQEELGDRASLHRTEIGMLEHGMRVARIDTLIKLAGAMAIPPSDLLEGIHWTPGDTRSGGFSFTDSRRPTRRRRPT
jgi:ribosome-binding protein aMBF1 (putative translation factor)